MDEAHSLPQYPADPPRPPESEPEPDRSLRGFVNLVFGVIIPAACLAVDPIVFQGVGSPSHGYSVAGYLAAGIGMASLISWTFLRKWPAIHAGLLGGGATFAACLGLLMIPYTIIGLFICIGVLGLSPFVTAWVFAREAIVAGALIRSRSGLRYLLLGFMLALCLPAAAQFYVVVELRQAMSEDSSEMERSLSRLRIIRFMLPVSQMDQVVEAYSRSESKERRATLARVYKELTGMDVERALVLRD